VIEICLLRIVVVLFLFGVSVLDNSRCDEQCTVTSCCPVCVHYYMLGDVRNAI
jgi:hypothetical protein